MNVVLAATQHDPDGRLYDQTARILPILLSIFDGVAVQATYATQARSLALVEASGALTRRDATSEFAGLRQLGHTRRATLDLALQLGAPFMLFCDFDRALHWAEHYPDELTQVVARIPAHDFTVLGRTARAFASHPRNQCETEIIINDHYARVSTRDWDVTAAARGSSAGAATAILSDCLEESVGTDVAWPLFIQESGHFTLSYIATEGLEFETADRYSDQIAAVGGIEHWIARLDADPRQWMYRLELAYLELAALLPYLT